jgi:hypothetical protein
MTVLFKPRAKMLQQCAKFLVDEERGIFEIPMKVRREACRSLHPNFAALNPALLSPVPPHPVPLSPDPLNPAPFVHAAAQRAGSAASGQLLASVPGHHHRPSIRPPAPRLWPLRDEREHGDEAADHKQLCAAPDVRLQLGAGDKHQAERRLRVRKGRGYQVEFE